MQDLSTWKANVDCTNVNAKTLAALLCNFYVADPSKGLGSVTAFVVDIVNLIIDTAGILAFVIFLYGCFLYVTSFGEETKAETAKKTLLWSIIGLAVISLAGIIMRIVKGAF